MTPQKKSIEVVVNPDLEIEEHLQLQKTGWVAQRIGLCIMVIFVLLALLGLFGDGILSKQTSTNKNVTLEYERFYRHEGSMELKIGVSENNTSEVDIAFPSEYLKNFEIRSILPEPKASRTAQGKVHYLFDAQGKTDIVYYLIPRKPGTTAGVVEVNDAIFSINHFIYP
jgi:hypothetical protein